MDTFALLEKLSVCDAPAGFEDSAAALAAELLRPYMPEIKTDVMGNVIALRPCGKTGAKRVLLDAHIDEIGLIITGASDGFLRFAPLGGVDPRILPASRVKILTEPPVFGVIDVMPPHVLTAEETGKAQKIADLRIDAGGAIVPAGTPVVFSPEPVRLGGRLFCGKAADDRACFAAIILALDKLGDTALDFDLYVLASAQEEAGTRGAKPAAYAIKPDYALIADVDFGDQPDVKPEESVKLGSGVTIGVGPNMNRALTRRITAAADKIDVKYTIRAEPSGEAGTNARVIQVAGTGCAAALLGVPVRYMHTPGETVDLRDVEALAELICETLKGGVFVD